MSQSFFQSRDPSPGLGAGWELPHTHAYLLLKTHFIVLAMHGPAIGELPRSSLGILNENSLKGDFREGCSPVCYCSNDPFQVYSCMLCLLQCYWARCKRQDIFCNMVVLLGPWVRYGLSKCLGCLAFSCPVLCAWGALSHFWPSQAGH